MFKSLISFKINKKKNTYIIIKSLIKFIQLQTTQNNTITSLIKELSKNTKVPVKILEQKSNQVLYRNFDFKNNKFKYLKLRFILIYFLKFLLLTILSLIGQFTLKLVKIKQKNYDLLCDNVFSQLDVDRYSKLIKYFNKVCLLGSYKKEKKIKKEEYYKYNKFLIGRSDFSFEQKIFFLFFGFKIFYYSLRYKINLFLIFLDVVYDLLKSSHLLSAIKSKFFITQKFYGTSPIFNYYFKKKGGKITACTQKNLCNLSLSPFVFTDVMFTLGKNQGKICNSLGGYIKYFKPVGSLFMEDAWFKKKRDIKDVPEADILILGINTLYNNSHYINNSYDESYYGFYLKWIQKLSSEFSQKKIIIKHHKDYTEDIRETNLIRNSNINVMIENKSSNSSYGWAFKSKIVLSFCSTMIIELLGHGKDAYYIDPHLKGEQWFKDVRNLKKYRLGSYKAIRSLINKRKKKLVKKSERDHYCLNSRNTSKEISKFLKSRV